MDMTGHFHDVAGTYDYCDDPQCPRSMYNAVVAECDALREQAAAQLQLVLAAAHRQYNEELINIEAHFARRLGLE